jgi:MFS family permease
LPFIRNGGMGEIMADNAIQPEDDFRARRNVWILVAAQAVLGSQMVMISTVAGLAGVMVAPNPCLGTLPVSMLVIGSMVTAPWLASLMQVAGRRTGFFVGAIGGALGAAISARALWLDSFGLFLLGSFISGIYISAQGFYRFAAADTASGAFRPKAISYVMASGLVSAVIGPTLGTKLADAYVVPFLGTYYAAIAICLIGMVLFVFLDIPTPPRPVAGTPTGRSRTELLRDPVILVAIICGMVSYALMSLVMTSTPLAVVGCGYETETAGFVITAHVLAMFAPSFVTGHLLARFGTRPIISCGLVILAGAGAVALSGVDLGNFYIALILLGIGWNFGFIGATAMLSEAHSPAEAGRVQGMNDMLVFGMVALASLVSGGLMNCTGGDAQQGWTSVNLAMVPFLALAGGALIWLTLKPED